MYGTSKFTILNEEVIKISGRNIIKTKYFLLPRKIGSKAFGLRKIQKPQ